jgi:pyruvate kinase
VRRAKIVATLGPALDEPQKLRAAVEAGIDVVRLNFSHGDADEHARRLTLVRELSRRLGRNVGVLADLQGPKIRLGILPDEGIPLRIGAEVFLVPGKEELDDYQADGAVALPVVYEGLASDVQPGALVMIDDGVIRLVVSRVEPDGLWARVVGSGVATSRKGVNLPGVPVSAPSLTDKDIADLKAAVELGIDWLALSFVRQPEDVIDARQRVHDLGGESPIVAKLERPEAIESLTTIAGSHGVGRARLACERSAEPPRAGPAYLFTCDTGPPRVNASRSVFRNNSRL